MIHVSCQESIEEKYEFSVYKKIKAGTAVAVSGMDFVLFFIASIVCIS